MYKKLFEPQKIGTMTVPNRIVMTAMGNHAANADGTVSGTDIAFYGARARGGAGLIITECACVDSTTGKGNLRQLSVDDDRFIPGLRRLAEEVHRYGSRLAVQIYHPGRQGIAKLNGVESMMSASRTECQCVHQPAHEMSLDEIHEITEKFAAGARRVKEAGADAVEIHGAHGYLIGQFLSPYTNKRTDEYGGSFENRMRFLAGILREVRKACGKDFPILVRFSVDEHMEYVKAPREGLHLSDGTAIAKYLEQQGADALDVSCGIYETMNTAWEPVGFDQGWKLDGPAAVKAVVGIPVIGVSVIREPAFAEKVLEEGKCDMIGSARAFLADPDWGRKAREGRDDEIRKCISCLYCMETLMEADQTGVHVGCAVNFEGCREDRYSEEKLRRDGAGRTVAVIGAGPAGMEAARVLALRGFRPVLFEKQPEVGGQILYACRPPKKEKTGWLIDYQKRQLEKLGVQVRTDTPADMEALQELAPYAVFIAQGSVPILPDSIPGIRGEHIYTPPQILSGEVRLTGQQIGVVGSGMTGIETAEYLASQGNKVSVFEMAGEIGPGIFFQNLIDVMGRINEYKPRFYPNHRLMELKGTTAVFEVTDTRRKAEYDFDSVIVSLGMRSNRELAGEVESVFDRVVYLGDARQAGRIEQAIRNGYLEAAELR